MNSRSSSANRNRMKNEERRRRKGARRRKTIWPFWQFSFHTVAVSTLMTWEEIQLLQLRFSTFEHSYLFIFLNLKHFFFFLFTAATTEKHTNTGSQKTNINELREKLCKNLLIAVIFYAITTGAQKPIKIEASRVKSLNFVLHSSSFISLFIFDLL